MCKSTANEPLCTGSAESADFQPTLREERLSPKRIGRTGPALALDWMESPNRSTGTTCQRGSADPGYRATCVSFRCKQSAVHWTVSGANAILALCSCVVGGRYEDYWERRAAAAGILTRGAVDRATEGREVTS